MSRKYWLILLLAAFTPVVAQAQKDVASCKNVLDASTKQNATPYHLYMSITQVPSDSKPQLGESISTGGMIYVLIDGKWQNSGMTPAAMGQQQQENIRNAVAYSCKLLRDESVGGVAASVYSAHVETSDVKNDSQIWIAKGTGLVLRIDTDMGTSHVAQRFEYTNVHPPAGVQ
jgi:hypothetical protein